MTTSSSLPERPRLAPWYRRVEEGNRLVCEHGGRAVVLEGAAVRRLLPALLPLLDGTRTPEELVEALGRPAGPAVDRALQLLAARGLLTDGPPPCGSREAVDTAEHLAFGAAVSPALAAGRLAAARVAVAGRSAAADEIVRLLRRAGVGTVHRRAAATPDGGDTLAVVAPAADETEILEAWNGAAIEAGAAWLPVFAADDATIAIGPLVLPRRTACLACRGRRQPRAFDAPPAQVLAAAAVAAEHVLRWVAVADPRLPGVQHVLEDDVRGLGLRAEPLQRVPRCSACSDALVRANALPWHEAA